ncbi:hypothetical protein OPV22_020364 [Ensete ventricosum]|uniref:Uncharacterized protein n=1 Tax=Ensete ventricosum TaxID=4639 RepID=A0AAV8QEI9_ENSVE|nr:hypothetical protein OPV22_020364 [Ensete ventricosum]
MEAIFCLRPAIVLPSTRPRRLAGFHPTSGLAPLRHLSFTRSWRRRHGVSCSHVPPRQPPPEEDEGKKGRSGGRKVAKVAAVGVAVVAACALGAVGLSGGAPVAPALSCTLRTVPTKDNGWSIPIQGPSTPGKMTVQATRDAMRDVLFGTKDLSVMGTSNVSSKNFFASPEMIDAGIWLVQRYIGKKDYHQAKEICQQVCSVKFEHDARPPLFMAVIYMMLTVERMLADSPTKNDLKELDSLIGEAKKSWAEYKKFEASAVERITEDGQQGTRK